MDNQEVRQWETALDDAEITRLDDGLPTDIPAGTIHAQDGRRWLRVRIVRGNTGGRWAYWLRMVNGEHEGFDAVVDKIFNGDAAHFIGMLAVPYAKIPGNAEILAWVLVEPKVIGPRVVRAQEEPVKERYERSKEVYDVETGKTEKLP